MKYIKLTKFVKVKNAQIYTGLLYGSINIEQKQVCCSVSVKSKDIKNKELIKERIKQGHESLKDLLRELNVKLIKTTKETKELMEVYQQTQACKLFNK